MPTPIIPSPTPFVPDTKTFLTLIGRGLSQHSDKIPNWDALFTLTSQQLRESGIEPARSRRYLLHWRDKFRRGEMGIGGDLQNVSDGIGMLKITEVPLPTYMLQNSPTQGATLTNSPGMRKVILNVAPDETVNASRDQAAKGVRDVKIIRASRIAGPHVLPVKGDIGAAKIVVKEGLWEIKRGHKVDGGERRKAEVRAKRRAAENKAARS